MAGKTFLRLVAGIWNEIRGVQSSAGAANAGDIPALDSTGLLDISMMPIGVTKEVSVFNASEALSAGNFVNLWSDSGTLKARKADGSTTGKEAHGFVIDAVESGAAATVYGMSNINTGVTGKTVGAKQYLSVTVAGATQETVPTVAGQIVQMLGIATSATSIPFQPNDVVVLA